MNASEKKFETIYEASVTQITRYVGAHVRDRQVAEDVVQEVYCTAWKKRKELLESENPMGWLTNTAKYKIMELQHRKDAFLLTLEESEINLECGEMGYEFAECKLVLGKNLSAKEYRLLMKRYYCEQSIREIADQEGTDENTLRMRMVRLKKKAERILGKVR